MASVQKDIHSYFKTKKNYSDPTGKSKLTDDVNFTTIKSERSIKKEVSEQELPSTPKSIAGSSKSNTRKRKYEQLESQMSEQSPTVISKFFSESNGKNATRSAKKKLCMTNKAGQGCSKQLKPEEVKERLGKCSRLDELREKLLKLNKCEEKLKKFRETSIPALVPSSPSKRNKIPQSPKKLLRMSPYKQLSCVPPSPHKLKSHNPQLEQFKALDIDVPLSPSKSPMKRTPVKTPTKAPCYQRFSHLATDENTSLAMPFRYRVIKEVFRAVDTVVSLMHNRQEMITYSKLKPAVQEIVRKTFSETHLGQIKSIFPLAYFFKQERLKNYDHLDDNRKSSYHLTVAANLNYKEASSVKTNLLDRLESKPAKVVSQYRKMDSVVLVERREVFHQALLQIVQKQHEDFLKTLDPPIVLNGTVRQWHPDFNLDDIPEPESSVLPKAPDSEAPKTARELFAKASSLVSVNNRMKSALESAAGTVSAQEKSVPAILSSDPKIAAALKGVSLSLLEKIRAREAAKATREMTRSGPETVELEMLSRLTEIARILRNLFVAEKKAALPWDIVVAKVASSYPSTLAARGVDSHLHLLIKEVPGWCTVHKVRSGTFLKIDKKRELQSVIDNIQSIIKSKS